MGSATAAAPDFEVELQESIAGFYGDPFGFVRFAFDWEVGDLAGESGPDEWQERELRCLGDKITGGHNGAIRTAISSGHGVGKGALAAWIILWAMSTRPDLNGVVTANTGSQLSTKTWRELAVWHKRAINRDWFSMTATRFFEVDNFETWFVAAIPWSLRNPEAFAGLHGDHVLTIYDEAGAIEDAIWDVSEGALTSPGAIWYALGNPTRSEGRFRSCFGRFKHRWRNVKVDSRTAKRADHAQCDEWVEDYGEDSDFVRVRVRGEFPRTGVVQLISHEEVAAAQSREAVGDGATVFGVDIARDGDDQNVVALRQGDRCEILSRWREADTMQTANRIAELITEYEPDAVFIEGDGVGGPVIDRLNQMGFRIVEVRSGANATDKKRYANAIAEQWIKMRDWVKRSGQLPKDSELAENLTSRMYGWDNQNRWQLERKRDMKSRGLSSPDDADAIAFTFAAPVREKDDLGESRRGYRPASANSWLGT